MKVSKKTFTKKNKFGKSFTDRMTSIFNFIVRLTMYVFGRRYADLVNIIT